jgi:hypothetical protein
MKLFFTIVFLISLSFNAQAKNHNLPGDYEDDIFSGFGLPDKTCVIDLDNNTYDCSDNERFEFISFPANHQAVLKIHLDAVFYRGAVVTAKYTGEPDLWTLNIGDSSSNNGFGGDGATQNNDAEIQIRRNVLGVYGNDYMGIGETDRFLYEMPNIVKQGDELVFTILNNKVELIHSTGKQVYTSPYLFALNGQPDNEGPVNYDIFAAFNRVISSSSRSGSGLGKVEIRLIPASLPMCVIDLEKNTFQCNKPSRFQAVAAPGNNRAVVKIRLDQYKFRSARFQVTYGNAPDGWSLNLGDSSTNDGYGGDAATQSNDAEIQILGTTFSAYGNDRTSASGERFLYNVNEVVEKGDTISIKITNKKMEMAYRDRAVFTMTPFLYALNGQPDWEGSVNYDIYAAFNRTINNASRSGAGVSRVIIILDRE